MKIIKFNVYYIFILKHKLKKPFTYNRSTHSPYLTFINRKSSNTIILYISILNTKKLGLKHVGTQNNKEEKR